MSSTTTNLTNINFMSESKYDSLTEIHDDELYAVKIDGLDGEQLINQNPNEDPVKVWTGTQEEYDALSEYDASTIYNITDGVGGDTIATTNGNNTFTGTNNFVTPSLNDNTTKVATTAWVNSVVNNKMSLTLLDFKWTDHILNNISWLRADTFSWQDGGVYEAAYNHLVADYNSIEESIYGVTNLAGDFYRYSEGDVAGAKHPYCWKDTNGYNCYTNTETPSVGDGTFVGSSGLVSDGAVESVIYTKQSHSETIGSYTITYYLAADGHKICLPDQETTIQNIYNESGVAWYYILDTANQRFKLPRTKYGFVGLRDEVGKFVEAGLPNITAGNFFSESDGPTVTGALYYESGTGYGSKGGTDTDNKIIKFDASLSNSIYGNSTTVQPPATQMYLYFYVGQFSQSATEQTAGVTTETLNSKLDTDVGNATSTTKETIIRWGIPDYTAGVSISSGASIQKNGYVVWYQTVVNLAYTISINGVQIFAGSAQYDNKHTGIFPVSKGDIVTYTNTQSVTFYPCKGVNNV